ncbi:hypothetical protein JO84_gp027 [Aureococcus anophagefferens virus]|uniref:Uncharacterized protein n=1 Tax=Aureococcus anophagefferens virus TaxID=1474867 RepID=A0A076FIH6_9VIRU|nr:hypothetical protein JO84_gp027 [Aureococcus anophagefferens virus]AII17261.1 hypothetical protein AaV_027 [Aureococcus anophagefferens virus]UOG94327.1 hypothetical protein MKD35_292 [Aureococcus anophagefferens virus]
MNVYFKIILLILILLFWIFNFEVPDTFAYKSTNTNNMPTLQKFPNFLSNFECKYLTKKLINHNENIRGVGLGIGFENLNGFTVIFKNKEEAKNLFIDKFKLPLVWNIFNKVVLPESNAFVINTLIINKSLHNSIDLHYDNTIEVETGIFNRELLAHNINIIYINVPNDILGGKFVAYKKNISTLHEITKPFGLSNFMPLPQPVIEQKPINGTFIKVRGDLLHKVNSFFSNTNEPRISLVIEEYKCSKKELEQVDEIIVRSKNY